MALFSDSDRLRPVIVLERSMHCTVSDDKRINNNDECAKIERWGKGNRRSRLMFKR